MEFTSESVTIGHPDKVADQIADAILDACLQDDPDSRVACEVMVTARLVIIAGEISTEAVVNYAQIARNTLAAIGYNDPAFGFDSSSIDIVLAINNQSSDIAHGIGERHGPLKTQGAGDSGMVFGYATNETAEFMPLPIILARQLATALVNARKSQQLPFLGPDGKTQVTLEYGPDGSPRCLLSVVVSSQHRAEASLEDVSSGLLPLIYEVLPSSHITKKTVILINPAGRFVIGGPVADTGLTGRKQIVDTYGGSCHHGGGALSGKDATKIDRTGAYAARYIAKHIVACGYAPRCEVQIAYAIGVRNPLSLSINTFGAYAHEEALCKTVAEIFDLTPSGLITSFDLRRPIFHKTSWGGHFGHSDPDFTWERLDKVASLQKALPTPSGMCQ